MTTKNIILLLCFEFVITNSRTSTLWRLNADETKIIDVGDLHGAPQFEALTDTVFNIIATTVHHHEEGIWLRRPIEDCCNDCLFSSNRTEFGEPVDNFKDDVLLDCGKAANFTYYDSLVGVSNRHRHPKIPDSQAALIYNKYKKMMKGDFDINALERKLKKAKKEKPKSVQLYNQIGNFWHYKGDTQKSIECFRRALAVSPHSAEVLLNLARVLFTLQYLDDAIFLTRRSLEVQPPDKGAWQQYFTLGEIFKTYGHYQDAAVHLRHTLELKPDFELAQLALKEMESMPTDSIHIYTLVIIICLVFGVLLVILTNVEPLAEQETQMKMQRHFNKAMAMKTLRGFTMKNARQRSK